MLKGKHRFLFPSHQGHGNLERLVQCDFSFNPGWNLSGQGIGTWTWAIFSVCWKNNICVHNEISFLDDEVLDVCM